MKPRTNPRVKKMIEEVKKEIVKAAGADLRLLILYGSEARGEATQESDIDILVVLENRDPEITRRVRDCAFQVMWEHDFARIISLHIMPFAEFEMQKHEGYSFVLNVEEEGRVLWPAA